jgi:hypothetical protein
MSRMKKTLFSPHPYNTRVPVPVPLTPREGQYHKQLPTPSWWMRCIAWGRYYSMQLRWDIERSLARLLHRRWSG